MQASGTENTAVNSNDGVTKHCLQCHDLKNNLKTLSAILGSSMSREVTFKSNPCGRKIRSHEIGESGTPLWKKTKLRNL